MPSKAAVAADARGLVRRAFKGSLATIDSTNSYPYASLITLATDASGVPSFLISTLARHTRNLAKDRRASVLIDATGALADPLQGARLTLYGLAEKTAEEGVRRRFLARHPEAAFYADFPDFAFFRLVVEGSHYIGGFGRIFDLAPGDLLVPVEGTARLLDGEPDIVEHMNKDHADALEDLRELAKGIFPAVLRDEGLAALVTFVADWTSFRDAVDAVLVGFNKGEA